MIPPYDPTPASAPPPRGSRRGIAIAITAGIVLIVAVFSVLTFAGVIRFGTPNASSLTIASKIDGRKRATVRKTKFDGSEQRIYCCSRFRAFEDTVLEARWFREGAQVGGFSGKFGALTRTSTVRFLVLSGDVAFYLTRPPAGWTGGSYRVRVYIDGKRAREVGFSLSSRGRQAGTTTYKDPGGLFTLELPNGWVEANAETLNGARAGFIGPGSGYAPRLVVVPTDFTSVDTSYLNGAVAQEGQQNGGQFQPYSMGNSPGARRDFEWDHMSGNTKLKLHSVQVVVQGADGKVYGINCHTEATNYDTNLPVFNSIISSFKL